MKLRSHLVMLVLAAVVPLLLFGALIVRQDVAERREILDRGMQDTVRALSSAVDGEVKTSIAVLQTLAASPFLDSGDFAHFHDVCERAMSGRPGTYVVLFDTTGKPLLNSGQPYGAALPNPITGTRPPGADARYPDVPLGGADPVKNVLEGAAPVVVSDLFISLVTQGPRIALDVPVIRAAKLRYVLEMSLDAHELARLLEAQRPPADAVLALLDRNGLAIARTVHGDERVGKPLAPELARQVAASRAGSGAGHTAEGMPVYHVHLRSPLTGWTTSLAVSKSAAQAPLSSAFAFLAGGAALAILMALAAALILGRRLATPISQLAASADALARGERPQVDVAAVSEMDELYRALVRAGEAAREVSAERERRQLAETSEAQAQAASRAKDEFLAMLSHELRNPLAALTAAAHVVRVADAASSEALSARRVIERQTKHMSRLIGDLLDVSRIAHGKLALDRERLELAEVLTRLVNVWRASGRFDRHRVSLEATPVWVDADRARIEQIGANLLDNAVKFTPAGKAITVSVAPQGDDALLCVTDEGHGIEREASERIFELFVQGGHGDEGGLGIGLALVKRLTEMHGGTVTLETPASGVGACFTVRLPAVSPPQQQPACVPRMLASRSILLVDDNEDARQTMANLLRLEGHEVRAAADGASGLALAGETHADVALIDIGLPDMDGCEMARRLRAVHNGRRLRLVALTGFGSPEDRQRTFEAGFDAHVVKPISAERLKQVLADLA